MSGDPHKAYLLDLVRVSAGLRLSLTPLRQPTATLQTVLLHPADVGELERLSAELRALLERARQRGALDAGTSAESRKLGQLLFDEVFPGPIKEWLRGKEGIDLLIRTEDALCDVPWELMHTGEAYLALHVNLGRLLATEGVGQPAAPRVLGSPREVLLVADPCGDLDAAYEEGLALRDCLDGLPSTRVVLRASDVSRADVRENLREADVLHFAGHAEVEGVGEGWLLRDGRLTADDLGRLSGGRPFPALVFANACGSGRQSVRQARSLARAFLRAGVRHYVGAHWDVPDALARSFALHFYRALAAGKPIGAAVRQARAALHVSHGDGIILWGSYCLYGDPDVVYFDEVSEPSTELRLPILDTGSDAKGSPRASGEVLVSALLQEAQRRPQPHPTVRGEASALEVPRFALGALEPRLLQAAVALTVVLALGLVAWGSWHGWGGVAREPLGAPERAPAVAAPLGEPAPSAADVEPAEMVFGEAEVEAEAPLRVSFEARALLPGEQAERPLRQGDALPDGARLSVRVDANREARAWVFLLDEGPRPQLLFPHPSAEAPTGDLLQPSAPRVLPGAQARWSLGARPGLETLLVLVSERPMEDAEGLLDELQGTARAARAPGGAVVLEAEGREGWSRQEARAWGARAKRLEAIQRLALERGFQVVQAVTYRHTR